MIKNRIVIFSTIEEDWGGSEELWLKTIPYLQEEGYEIFVLKSTINFEHNKFKELAKNNVQLIELKESQKKQKKGKAFLRNKLLKKIKRVFRIPEAKKIIFEYPFITKTKEINPVLVIIAQGINFDGLEYAYQFYLHRISYATISQKAVDFFWPNKNSRPFMKIGLLNAEKCFFVSKHNLNLTEQQFGIRLTNALIVNNPIKLLYNNIPYPSTENGFHLACVGRLFVLDKGQDILLKILSSSKWKSRPVYVSFIGEGTDYISLVELAKLLNVENVKFEGFVEDIASVWHTHHALVLPSRSEGMPLAMLEAMAAGRTVIVSDAGGNSEIITDGDNGFIGNINIHSFEDALERAWTFRNKWEEIGNKAAKYIERRFQTVPEKLFANEIIKIVLEAKFETQ